MNCKFGPAMPVRAAAAAPAWYYYKREAATS